MIFITSGRRHPIFAMARPIHLAIELIGLTLFSEQSLAMFEISSSGTNPPSEFHHKKGER
jgi:hypothetical protein